MFDKGKPSSRPFAGKFELLGAPAHRAVARQAVRESLVLLKNQGHVLPLSPKLDLLVAGDGADNIPKQSGGWTISWQGTGMTNADFPHAQSIYAGIAEAAKAAGGSATLSPDGSFTKKPGAAIVVFGEDPYAEFAGDRPTVEYRAGDTRDLALLKKLKAQGIPVVAVFLSGRPLWVNPEINAADCVRRGVPARRRGRRDRRCAARRRGGQAASRLQGQALLFLAEAHRPDAAQTAAMRHMIRCSPSATG